MLVPCLMPGRYSDSKLSIPSRFRLSDARVCERPYSRPDTFRLRQPFTDSRRKMSRACSPHTITWCSASSIANLGPRGMRANLSQ
jgi:hypothetical protein